MCGDQMEHGSLQEGKLGSVDCVAMLYRLCGLRNRKGKEMVGDGRERAGEHCKGG